ncbi:MAG: hypothetical protein WDM79_12300 [Terricaulis sp.]
MTEIEPLARAGEMNGEQFANLYDDVAEGETGLQRYGTNFNCRDGRWQPNPIEAPESVNERRAALRMDTIEAAAAIMQQMYGACPNN